MGEKIGEQLADAIVDGMKARLKEELIDFWVLLQDALLDFGYIAALWGGGGLIIAKVCGSTRAMKYFVGIQALNIFIQGLLR